MEQEKRMVITSGGESIYFIIHGIMAQIIIAKNVYIQVYNYFIIGQILHVSNGSIFF
jgi:hypothetical protein